MAPALRGEQSEKASLCRARDSASRIVTGMAVKVAER
jgi:hypothetical protein